MWSDLTGLNPTAQKPSAATLAQMFEPIRDDLREVEREFARHVQSQVALIPTIGNYIQDGGGKRIRPAVLLMAARMAGYTRRARRAVRVGRRVHPHRDARPRRHHRRVGAAPRPRGRAHAVGQPRHGAVRRLPLPEVDVAGAEQDSLEIIRLLCDVTLRIVEGEIYQLTKNGVVGSHRGGALRHRPPQDGVPLRRLAPRSAACSGRPTREQQDALWDYGLNIGMAFQIVDDLLDFTGEEEALGKPVGGDLREGKMTLPVIHLLRARRRARRRADPARSSTRATASLDEWRELRALLAQARSIDYAHRDRRRVRRARQEGALRVPAVRGARRADVPARLRDLARSLDVRTRAQAANQTSAL